MSDSSLGKDRSGSLGYVLIVFALIVFYFSKDIRELGFGNNSDPGPKLFPIGLSVLIALGGAIEIYRNWKVKGQPAEAIGLADENSALDVKSKQLRAGALMGLFFVYILAMPYLGFTLGTLVFATAMMMLLRFSWKMALSVSVALTLVVNLLFGMLFHVPLPRGILGLLF